MSTCAVVPVSVARTRRFLPGLITAAIAGVALVSDAAAQTGPAQAPELKINSPFASVLWRIDVDRAESNIAAASLGKFAVAWHIGDLDAARVLRVPLRAEQRRRAHGVAITPDGEYIAYSVPPETNAVGHIVFGSARIYLMRRNDGTIVTTIDSDVPTRPQALRFSPDGAYMAATLSSGCGLRVWSIPDGVLVYKDDEGYAGQPGASCMARSPDSEYDKLPDTTGLLFDVKGGAKSSPLWIATAGGSGIRTYSWTGRTFVLAAHVDATAAGLQHPEGLAVSPDGEFLVVGDRRVPGEAPPSEPVSLRIAVLDAGTLRSTRRLFAINQDSVALKFPAYLDPLQVPDARQFNLPRVLWVEEGGKPWLLAAGFFACDAAATQRLVRRPDSPRDNCIVRWPANGESRDAEFFPVGVEQVMDLVWLRTRQALVIASQKQISLTDLQGSPLVAANDDPLHRRSRAADFRARPGLRFDISSDGKSVLFEDYRSSPNAPLRLRFDTEHLTLQTDPTDNTGFLPPEQDPNYVRGMTIRGNETGGRPAELDWRNSSHPPRIVGKTIEDPTLDPNDLYRSVALLKPRRLAVLGSSNFLRVIGFASGKPTTLCQTAIAEESFRVNITPDARVIVVGHADGVLRWYRHRPDGNGCRIDLALSVYLAATDNGEWTWLAWTPSGDFANDPRAQDLLIWQARHTTGQAAVVDFSQLLDWHAPERVARALDIPLTSPLAAPPDAYADGRLLSDQRRGELQQKAKPSVLSVFSPAFGASVARERVRFRLQPLSGARWPANLTIKTVGGILAEAIQEGHRFPPGEPILIAGTRILELDVVLPETARTHERMIDVCFYLDGALDTCHPIEWRGTVLPPPPRRLWGIFVGFSKHQAPGLTLRYAQNDALDMAGLFLEDHVKRAVKRASSTPADYVDIHLDVVVAPTNAETEEELVRLSGMAPYVTRREPTLLGILSALDDIIKKDARQELMHDLLFFYFSGHGFRNPFPGLRHRTLFATPVTGRRLTQGNLHQSVLTSEILIDRLNRISAEKILVLDACRTAPEVGISHPFVPGLMTLEFAAHALSAHVFFSADENQRSFEQPDFVYRKSRKTAGNSLFAYGFLKALTSREADLPGDSSYRNKIEVDEINRYLKRMFDFRDSRSVITQIGRKRGVRLVQTPIYLPSNMRGPVLRTHNPVVRSLDQN